MALIRSSSSDFSFFSLRKSRDRRSSSVMARILSASAFRLRSSSCNNARLSTRFLVRSSSSWRSRRSSRSYLRSSDFWSRSSFTRAVFLMCFARFANFTVDKLSANASSAGEIIAIMVVLQLPPSESSNTRVSLLSRYGTCDRFPLASVSALITFPSAERL